MTEDIVTRLVAVHGSPRCTDAVNCVVCEAADEIERLRAELDAEGNETNLLMLEIERLRADLEEAYDACRYALADSPRWRENAATVVTTWEARRG